RVAGWLDRRRSGLIPYGITPRPLRHGRTRLASPIAPSRLQTRGRHRSSSRCDHGAQGDATKDPPERRTERAMVNPAVAAAAMWYAAGMTGGKLPAELAGLTEDHLRVVLKAAARAIAATDITTYRQTAPSGTPTVLHG